MLLPHFAINRKNKHLFMNGKPTIKQTCRQERPVKYILEHDEAIQCLSYSIYPTKKKAPHRTDQLSQVMGQFLFLHIGAMLCQVLLHYTSFATGPGIKNVLKLHGLQL